MIRQNRIIFLVLLSAAFTTYVQCQSDNQIDLDVDLEKLKKNLPEGIVIPPELQNVTLPSVDEVKKLIKDKCAKISGGDAAYEAIERGAEELKNCTSGLIVIEELQEEIKKAEPNGELDTVFNKYCRKRDIAIGCMENFTSVLEPCLEPEELEGKRTFVKIFKNLLNFVCNKDGDQIALFIAEKGPECFDQRKDDLINCMNATFYGYLPADKSNLTAAIPNELPQLVMGEKQCNEMDTLQVCIVKALETCEESTPANLVESMFKFMRSETPCVNFTSTVAKATDNKTGNNANIFTVSSALLVSIVAFVTIRLV